MEALVVVGLLVALALAAPRWGADSRGLNVHSVEMELALERVKELRGQAARRRIAPRVGRRAPGLALPRLAAFHLGGLMIRCGEALRTRSVQSLGWNPTGSTFT